ncbi:uncharacterized [Tachysurus ichikawai]
MRLSSSEAAATFQGSNSANFHQPPLPETTKCFQTTAHFKNSCLRERGMKGGQKGSEAQEQMEQSGLILGGQQLSSAPPHALGKYVMDVMSSH